MIRAQYGTLSGAKAQICTKRWLLVAGMNPSVVGSLGLRMNCDRKILTFRCAAVVNCNFESLWLDSAVADYTQGQTMLVGARLQL